jgi:hypothetical protein
MSRGGNKNNPPPSSRQYLSRGPPPRQQFKGSAEGTDGTPTRGRPPSNVRSAYCTPSPSRAAGGMSTRERPPSRVRSTYQTPSTSPRPRSGHRSYSRESRPPYGSHSGGTTRYKGESRGTRPENGSDSRGTPPRRQSRTSPRRSNSAARNAPRGHKRIFTEEERSSCPFDDTRWPPRGEYLCPLHLLYTDEGARERIYYNLIYQNTAFEATEWYRAIEARAAETTSEIPNEETAQTTIVNAFHSQKLRVISEGKRGRIWVLNEGCEEVWARMGSMEDERGAVRVSTEWESFAVFGIGLKGNMGDVLLVSWPFPEKQVRMSED